MSGGSVEDRCRFYAKASLVLDKGELEEVEALCVLLKKYFHGSIVKLVDDAAGRPVLASYSSDGTPLLTKQRMRMRTKGMSQAGVVRVGGSSHEFLIQQAFVRYLDASGACHTAVAIREPLPLTEGKSAWSIWAAGRDFAPSLSRVGHRGLALQHVAFDRALHRPLVRHFSELYALESEGPTRDGAKDLLSALRPLLTWVLETPCANHDAHNGLKWGLFVAFQNTDLINDIYIAVESLRNGYCLLHDHLGLWLQECIAFVKDPEPEDRLLELYIALGIEQEWAERISKMGLLFRRGRLEVSVAYMTSASLFEDLSASLFYLWRFTRFSDSRWCTVGRSCRTLTAALLTGVGALVDKLLADHKVSSYYISGFEKLAANARRVVVMCAIGSYPSDAVLGELLEDDRLVRHLPRVEEALEEELAFICDLSGESWDLLALAACTLARALRADTIAAAHASAAFITVRTLREARTGFWALLHGDLQENLEALKAQEEEPDNDTVWKVKRLLEIGYNREQMLEALELARDVSWSTTGVEQQHGSASTIMKMHDGYSKETMCTRSLLHAARQFFSAPVEQQETAALKRKLSAMENKRRRVANFGGRQLYLKELVQLAGEHQRRGKKQYPDGFRQTVMQRHSMMWNRLNPETRRKYEQRARMEREVRAKTVEDNVTAAQEALALGLRRQADAKHDRSRRMVLSQCRFSAKDRAGLDDLWRSMALTRKQVKAELAKAMVAPPAPPEEVQSAMSSVVLREPAAAPRPFWLRALCQHREVFSNTALVAHVPGRGSMVFKFAFAQKSPCFAAFAPMVEVDESFVAAPLPLGGLGQAAVSTWRYKYHCAFAQVITSDEVAVVTPSELWALSGLCCLGKDIVATDNDAVPWAVFVDGLPVAKHRDANAKARQRPSSSSTLSPEMLAAHPWLEGYLTKRQAPQAGRRSHATEAGNEGAEPERRETTAEAEGEEPTADEVEAIFQELHAKRQAWLNSAPHIGDDFGANILGGVGTKKRSGVSSDYFIGHAKTKAAEAWCRQYCTGLSARFSISLYGDDVAGLLSRFWASKMQHLYHIYVASGEKLYQYTDSDIASWVEPPDMAERFDALSKEAKRRLADMRALRPSQVGSTK